MTKVPLAITKLGHKKFIVLEESIEKPGKKVPIYLL